MKQLFTVTVEAEIVVVAESAEEAEDVAAEAMSELSSYDWDIRPMPMKYLPAGWDRKALPFGTDDDKSIAEWLEAGAGEIFLQEQAAFKERVERAKAAAVPGTRNATPSPPSGTETDR